MTNQQKQDFTRRLTQCNRGGLIIIMYDIYFAYLDDAKAAYANAQWDSFKEPLRNAQRMLEELISSLDFSYSLAKDLCSIYIFCRDTLSRAMYRRSAEDLETAERLMERLYDAFCQAAAQDQSEPLMRNTQKVYAGYTYGRNDLVETYQDPDTSRGFLA